jgi:RNase H-fold protein (predicted Holliday junction resolvase)
VEAALRAVEDLARERGVETIVVGYPLSLRGRKTLSTEKAEAFAEALRGRLPEVGWNCGTSD